MLTQKVQECVEYAFSQPNIAQALHARDVNPNFTIRSITSKIIQYQDSPQQFNMIVRIGVEYAASLQTDHLAEDLLIDVAHQKNKQSGAESFDVVYFIHHPGLPVV